MAKQLVEFELAEGPLLVEVILAELEGERLPRRVEQSWQEAEAAGAVAPSLETRRQTLLIQSCCALIAASLNSSLDDCRGRGVVSVRRSMEKQDMVKLSSPLKVKPSCSLIFCPVPSLYNITMQ